MIQEIGISNWKLAIQTNKTLQVTSYYLLTSIATERSK